MQAVEGGKKTSTRREEAINFRPSPNFKHMKKYLKSKFEETSNSSTQSHEKLEKTPENKLKSIKTEHPKEKSTNSKTEKAKVATVTTATATATASATVAVQPPLPPNPPPPDIPEIRIKQEVIDEDYLQYTSGNQTPQTEATAATLEELYAQYATTIPDQNISKGLGIEPTMCRNYVRGTCKKGSSCIFVHALILSQLPGVYTFCRNFQNRQCTFARCKFVHATVFEKEYFYRTGYLPPHAVAHLKASPPPPPPPPAPPPPPPPPPPEDTDIHDTSSIIHEGYYTTPTVGASSMPVMVMDCSTLPTYMVQAPLTSGLESDLYASGSSTSNATITSAQLKRSWCDQPSYTQTELGTGEPLPKKCKNCDSNEFRYQYHKNKVENMLAASEEVNKKLSQINSKSQRLCTVLVTLFKPQSSAATSTPGPGLSTLTTALDDKEKVILDQVNLLLGTNTRLSAGTEEDNVRNQLSSNVNFQNIMTKLLMSAADQPPAK